MCELYNFENYTSPDQNKKIAEILGNHQTNNFKHPHQINNQCK